MDGCFISLLMRESSMGIQQKKINLKRNEKERKERQKKKKKDINAHNYLALHTNIFLDTTKKRNLNYILKPNSSCILLLSISLTITTFSNNQ